MSRDLNHHRNRHARPEFPTSTACQPLQTPRSDGPAPDFAGALSSAFSSASSPSSSSSSSPENANAAPCDCACSRAANSSSTLGSRLCSHSSSWPRQFPASLPRSIPAVSVTTRKTSTRGRSPGRGQLTPARLQPSPSTDRIAWLPPRPYSGTSTPRRPNVDATARAACRTCAGPRTVAPALTPRSVPSRWVACISRRPPLARRRPRNSQHPAQHLTDLQPEPTGNPESGVSSRGVIRTRSARPRCRCLT